MEIRKELFDIELELNLNSPNACEKKLKSCHFSIPDLKTELSKVTSDFGLHSYSNENFGTQRTYEGFKGSFCSTFSKKSLTFRKQRSNKDPPIIEKLKNVVGTSISKYVRNIFEKFSSGEKHKYITYSNFKKFLNSYSLIEKRNLINYFKDDSKNVRYSKYIKGEKSNLNKKIDFLKFIEILFFLAADYYPEIKPSELALEKFVRSNILEKEQTQNSFLEQDTTLTKLNLFLSHENIKEYIKSNDNLFLKLFDSYKSIDANEGYHITFTDYLKLCKDRQVCPFLMSNREIEKIYRFSQQIYNKNLILNCLSYEGFINSILLIALLFFELNKNTKNNDSALQKIQKVINYLKI